MDDPDPPTPFYRLPPLTDLAHWDKVQVAGLHQPAPAQSPNGTPPKGWQRLNLAQPQYGIPPEPPAIHGLLYAGKRHVLSGPQESAKTLIAYWLLLQALEAGHGVAIIDFEMGPVATRRMLTDLGAEEATLPLVCYFEPTQPPQDTDIQQLLANQTDYALIDASAGAFDASGLDDNSRKDAETFSQTWIQPLFREGIATIVLDHVTKNTETRGKYAIGSERKTGGADVHLGFEALKTLTRGGTGVVKITAHKDRGAYLPRPTAAIAKLASDSQTHDVTITIEPPTPADDVGTIKHTIYAERVSKTLETNNGEPMSQTQIETNTTGDAVWIRKAIEELEANGNVSIAAGLRNSKMVTLLAPYIATPLNPVATPLEHGQPSDPVGVPIGTLGNGVGDGPNDEVTPLEKIDVYDPTIQHLLDDTPDW